MVIAPSQRSPLSTSSPIAFSLTPRSPLPIPPGSHSSGRSRRGRRVLPETVSVSRRKHRESAVWQRRFWEHPIRDEQDLQGHLDDIHFNPVKHGWVLCPHWWEFSSHVGCVSVSVTHQLKGILSPEIPLRSYAKL